MKSIQALRAIVLLGFLAAGCYSPVENVEVPESKSKFVVFGFISPEDSIISISVTKSQPIFNSEIVRSFPIVTDAEVVLSSSQGSVNIPYNSSTKRYEVPQHQYPVYAGDTYELRVTTIDGKELQASTTIPAAADLNLDISGSFEDTVNSEYYSFPRLQPVPVVRWKDGPHEGDFYRVDMFYYEVISSTFGTETDTTKIYTSKSFNMFRDVRFNGKTNVYYPRNSIYSTYDITDDRIGSGIIVKLTHADVHYYHHHEGLNRIYQDDSPFVQVAPYYSNISGGLGVFGSYLSYTAVKEF